MSAAASSAELERELGKAIVKAVGRKDARRLLNAPTVLQSAVAAASATWEALGAKGGRSRLPVGDGSVAALDRASAKSKLAPFIMEGDWEILWPDDELLTTDETAELIGKSQPTVLEWIKKGRIIGLTRNKRGYRVPKEQFARQHKVIEEITKVTALLPDHNIVWSFLTEPYPFESGLKRPIDLLKKGAVEDVIAAATSWGSDFS